jgi:hypothetical protein
MGQVAMTVFSLQEAVERTGTSKVDIWRAIQAGTLSAKKTDEGGFAIDSVDLFAVFETKQTDQCLAEDAVASLKTSESPETTGTPETSLATNIAVAFAARGHRRALSSCEPRRQRVENCVRMRGPRSTYLNKILNWSNRPLRDQKSKRWPDIPCCWVNKTGAGGGGLSDGSARIAPRKPGGGCEKGCTAEKGRRFEPLRQIACSRKRPAFQGSRPPSEESFDVRGR